MSIQPQLETVELRRLRWSGSLGLLAAIVWTIGDMLIVGEAARPEDYPLLLERYVSQIDFPGLQLMLPASEPRLAAGALVSALTSTLYLAGAWHLCQIATPAGTRWSRSVFGLFIVGYANAPLAHAGFYFVGMIYKTILVVPEDAHAQLLILGNQFFRVLLIVYVVALGSIVLGFLLLAILTGLGRTRWPRWFALIVNPVSLGLIGSLLPWITPQPLRTWLGGAGISIGTLLVFGMSLWTIRHRGAR